MHTRNNGRDPFPLLVKRGKVLKDETNFYNWKVRAGPCPGLVVGDSQSRVKVARTSLTHSLTGPPPLVGVWRDRTCTSARSSTSTPARSSSSTPTSSRAASSRYPPPPHPLSMPAHFSTSTPYWLTSSSVLSPSIRAWRCPWAPPSSCPPRSCRGTSERSLRTRATARRRTR